LGTVSSYHSAGKQNTAASGWTVPNFSTSGVPFNVPEWGGASAPQAELPLGLKLELSSQ